MSGKRDKRKRREKRQARRAAEQKEAFAVAPAADAPLRAPAPKKNPARDVAGPTTSAAISVREEERVEATWDLPPAFPQVEDLERLAALDEPDPRGAWWITIQAAQHLVECATVRDAHTGESLPVPLVAALERPQRVTRSENRPIPNDRIQRSSDLCFDPLRKIISRPKTRLLREHEQRPIHSIREVDARCMAWMARLPGRNVREKLSGRQRALAVVRRFTPDTLENRVVRRVVEILLHRLEDRFEYAESYDGGPFESTQRELLDFCRRSLRDESFGSIPASELPRTNNVLLGDRDYSRVWRAWMLLHGSEENLKEIWKNAEELYVEATYWSVAGAIARVTGARVAERLVCPDADSSRGTMIAYVGDNAGIERMDFLSSSTSSGSESMEAGRNGNELRSAPEARSICVERNGRGMRVILKALRAVPEGTGTASGNVKFVKTEGDRLFGFICGSDGGDYYFDPRTAGDDETYYSLRQGDCVTFTPGRKPAKGNAPACGIRHARKPGIGVAYETDLANLELELRATDGEDARSLLQRARGFPFQAEWRSGGAPQRKLVVPADLGGVRQVIASTLGAIGIASRGEDEVEAPKTNGHPIGIDTFGGAVFVGGAGQSWSTETLPYALRHSASSSHPVWQVGSRRRLPSIDGELSIFPMDANLGVDEIEDESAVTTACHMVARALADEVRSTHLGETAFVVPDGMDEFSQQTLRAALIGAFPRSVPVARSVASALAWQCRDGFTENGVRDGDAVLVLCSDVEALTFSLLVARWDRRLEETLPESGGIYWERRPAIPADEYGEGLGLFDLWHSHAQRMFEASRKELLEGGCRTFKERLLSYLVDSGLLRETVERGGASWIRDHERWIVVEHAEDLWRGTLMAWRNRFATALRSGLGRVLASALPNRGTCHLLFVGPPFADQGVFDSVRSAITRDITREDTGKAAYIRSEEGELTAGASEFLKRARAGLPAWRDWLPDLFLEIIRDGLYDELELISGEAVDATFGSVRSVDIAERIVLPAGHSSYEFSLVAGRANRRPMPVDLRLESSAFPLAEDTAVRLNLRYRYGVENGYELSVTPDDPQTAPFERIVGVWGRASGAAKPETAGEYRPPDPVPRPVAQDGFTRQKRDVARALMSVSQQVGRIFEDESSDVEELIESTTQRLRPLTRWMVDCGRLAEDDATAAEFQQEVAETVLVPQLLAVVGIAGDWQGPSERVGRYVVPDFRAAALVFLCSLGQRVPNSVVTWLRNSIATEENVVAAHASIADAIGTLFRADPSRHWIDALWKNVITRIEPFENPRLHGEAMGVLARQAWRFPEFVLEFAERTPGFVSAALRLIERGLRAIASKAAQALDKDSDVELLGGHVRGFQTLCELTLALLRLRGTELGVALAPGSPRMARLAKTIRMTDSLIVRVGKTPRTSLRLGVVKSDDLHRVSDLAYAANSFLLGAEGLNLIRIDAGEDED